MQITKIEPYDKKRKKIVLDEGAVCFLLYAGEFRKLGLSEGEDLSESAYRRILEEILKPRARKRVIAYLKDGDKTSAQIRMKLRQGFYPEEAVSDALSFLEHHRLVDDRRYAETYIEELRGKKSRREIEARLAQRGLRGSAYRELLDGMFEKDDEYAACLKALRQKLGRRCRMLPVGYGDEDPEAGQPDAETKRKLYGFLARKGFSGEAIEYSFRHLEEEA